MAKIVKLVPGKKLNPENTVQLPPFRFVDMRDANNKLANSIIIAEDTAGRVLELREGLGERGVILRLTDEDETIYHVPYTEEAILGCPRPGYIALDNTVKMFCRKPARQQMQGITVENSYLLDVGNRTKQPQNPRNFGYDTLIRAFQSRGVVKYTAAQDEMLREDILRNLRLSNRIALFRHRSGIFVEHRGFTVGAVLPSRQVRLIGQTNRWLLRDLKQVGMEVAS